MSDNEKDKESTYFEETIQQAIKDIQSQIEQIKNCENSNVDFTEINTLSVIASKLKCQLVNVDYQYMKRSSFLFYDKKLKELLKKIESLKYELIQKENKKGLCSLYNNNNNNADDAFLIPQITDVNEESDENHISENEFDLKQYKLSFHNLKNQRIIKGSDETSSSSLKLDNLSNCEILFLSVLSSVLIQKVENCTIWLAAVESSVLIYNCVNCNILTNTKQLRIHDTKTTNFYITTTTFPIIENSSDLSFFQMTLYYDGLSELLQKINLHEKSNKWKNILDFNWQNAEIPSPNFRIIDKAEKIEVIIKKKKFNTKDVPNNNEFEIENFPSFLKKIE